MKKILLTFTLFALLSGCISFHPFGIGEDRRGGFDFAFSSGDGTRNKGANFPYSEDQVRGLINRAIGDMAGRHKERTGQDLKWKWDKWPVHLTVRTDVIGRDRHGNPVFNYQGIVRGNTGRNHRLSGVMVNQQIAVAQGVREAILYHEIKNLVLAWNGVQYNQELHKYIHGGY